jgi:hypothetical protein
MPTAAAGHGLVMEKEASGIEMASAAVAAPGGAAAGGGGGYDITVRH